MKRSLTITFTIVMLLLSVFLSEGMSQTMDDYCQIPPFVGFAVAPNVLFVMDLSGSMSWKAYSYGDTDSNGDGYLDNYNPAVSYEGYFTPSKLYTLDSNGIYEETTPTGDPCICTCVNWRCRWFNWGGCEWHGGGCSRWGCCIEEQCSGDCNLLSGNYLNYAIMARIDLLRWALTGGTPSTCTGAQTFNHGFCNPELWNQPGNDVKVGSVCNNSLDVNGDGTADGGCILLTDNGTKIKVPWDRVYAGLASKFKALELRPRVGAMFYSGSAVRSQKIYIGDFTAPDSTADEFPYMNFISYVNSGQASGATPTGPAMWDALNYFSQKTPEYGGFQPQMGEGDRWKNPMYVCEKQGGVNCQYVPCANNFVILLSDGQWNTGGGPPAYTTCSINSGFENHSADPVVPAYKMHMGFDNIVTGVHTNVKNVYAVGLFLGGTGEHSMKNVAVYGSFDNLARTWPANLTGYPDDTCYMADCGTGRGSPCEPLPASSPDWDKDGDGNPDTYYQATDALSIKDNILDAVLSILQQIASGTAASVLASGEGTGANLVQAIFYQQRSFGTIDIEWTGSIKNLWYHIDPMLINTSIREDTASPYILDLSDDYIINFFFDPTDYTTKAKLFSDANGDGVADSTVPEATILFDNIKALWEAGKTLHQRNPGDRTIYTYDGANRIELPDTISGGSSLIWLMQAANADEASALAMYTKGTDLKTCSVNKNICSSDTDCSDAGETCKAYRNRTVTYDGVTNTWKLGDIINSTPRIVSWTPLNFYHKIYQDTSYEQFTKSDAYMNRGLVLVGANDGMLHAFRFGKLELFEEKFKKAALTGAELGKEEWAFIPKNTLPYLKYIADPNYCHIYTIDMTPYVFDASIGAPGTGDVSDSAKLFNGSTWRTVVIGGMRLGGACNDAATQYKVQTPIAGEGFSSYFALDITDTGDPQFLWEFSHPDLGFATTGPAVVRISSRTDGAPDNSKNGKWFVVFASGPTGPINTVARQFKGYSDQNLKVFILDLKTGQLMRTIDTGIQNAFAGSLTGATIDFDQHEGSYQDDALYFGYTKAEESPLTENTKWTKGGVIRILTKEDPNPDNWAWSKVIDNIGPVTSAVASLQNYKTKVVRLYFGTGRYFYKIADEIDDADSIRKLYGIVEPCFTATGIDVDCNTTVSEGSLGHAASADGSTDPEGWYIILDSCTDAAGSAVSCGDSSERYKTERSITDPLATFAGVVFFTTSKPASDICGFGGTTHLWAVKYDTGGAVSSSVLRGQTIMQVSTGSIEEIDLKTEFTQKDGRRTAARQGVPPQGPPPGILMPPKPVKKFIHIQER